MSKILTVSNAQAKALGLLVQHTPTKYPILYDPKSGVNLRETKLDDYIIIKDGADLKNINRWVGKYCNMIEQAALTEIVMVAAFNAVKGTELPTKEVTVKTASGEFKRAVKWDEATITAFKDAGVGSFTAKYSFTLPKDVMQSTPAKPLNGQVVITIAAE